MHAVAIMT